MDKIGELSEFADFVLKLLTEPVMWALPQEFKGNTRIEELYDYILNMRTVLLNFAQGNFDDTVTTKGSVGGALKNLQANLQHLSWQVEMVAKGDFDQRVDFMGKFSDSFNGMVVEFEQTLKSLTEQKELLDKEVAARREAEEALRKSEERYRTLSRMDALTDLYNRRYFFELASAEAERLYRNKSGCCALGMIDIDFFKQLNDTYGHHSGDVCLIFMSKLLRRQTRKFDVVGRYGGEEFIVMLPNADGKSGYNIFERFRKKMEESEIEVMNGTVKITVSIGYSLLCADDIKSQKEIDSMLNKTIREADEALYVAKNNGRNQVRYYDKEVLS